MDKRILDHPVLGKTPERELVKFTYNGKTLEGYKGEPIATALKVAGVMAHRYTKKKHESFVRLEDVRIVSWSLMESRM